MQCLVKQWTKMTPHAPAIRHQNKTLSYSELDQLIEKKVTSLSSQSHQNIPTIVAHPTIDTLVMIFACRRLGLPLSLLNPHENQSPLPLSTFDFNSHSDPSDLPFLLFKTSGSMANPKIAVLSYANFFYSAKGFIERFSLTSKTSWYLSLPLFHVAGVCAAFRVFYVGATLILPTSKDHLINDLQEQLPTWTSMVPTQLYRILSCAKSDKNLSQIHFMVGGSKIGSDLLLQAKKNNLKIYLTYGMTEMASSIAMGYYCIGKVLPHRNICIDEKGHICVGGETLFLGYIIDKKFTPTPLTHQNCFITSDLGSLLPDQSLIVHGRSDRVIIKGGENISLEEIEDAIYTVPGVISAKVIGKEHPEYGEIPIAFIESHPFDLHSLRSLIEKVLPPFKRPHQILPMPSYEGIKVRSSDLPTGSV
ncbi:MAG: AMP-binding protein [Simkaniaceae bacterium]|nr:AMP-binding protein [Simkaniaceae bacterium]